MVRGAHPTKIFVPFVSFVRSFVVNHGPDAPALLDAHPQIALSYAKLISAGFSRKKTNSYHFKKEHI